MASFDESPQIGRSAVDRDALAETGMPLAELAASLGLELEPDGDFDGDLDDVPTDGWRILRHEEGGSAMVGSPREGSPGQWFIGYAPRSAAEGALHVHEEPMTLRPSPAERRRGLALRWPEVVTGDPEAIDFVVDIVNTGDERWVPDGDGFQAVGSITAASDDGFGYGYFSQGTPPGVPLDPGEYARVTVSVGEGIWHDLEPGTCWLRAVVVDLGLTAEPLRLHLTPGQIDRARERAQRRSPRMRRTHQRRMLTDRLAGARATRAAREHLVAIAAIVAEAKTEAEALERVADLLGGSVDEARSVLQSPLDMLGASAGERLDAQIAGYEATLAEL